VDRDLRAEFGLVDRPNERLGIRTGSCSEVCVDRVEREGESAAAGARLKVPAAEGDMARSCRYCSSAISSYVRSYYAR